MMIHRSYYSTRTGRHKNGVDFSLATLQKLLLNTYLGYERKYYFQEAFGYYCVDADGGKEPGCLGSDIGAQIFLALRKKDLWPIRDTITSYSEDDCFDMIEFLYDHVSKPLDGAGYYHSFNNCGWHYDEFEKEAGQIEFRNDINMILQDYQSGWALSAAGEVMALADDGFQGLLEADLPCYDHRNVEQRVTAAIRKFRTRDSTVGDRRDAVRDLVDVLEFLRPKAKKYLLTKKEENDLFEIANSFAIRHHNPQQKSDYDKGIWYNWMFYVYLATIHAVVRVIKKNEG